MIPTQNMSSHITVETIPIMQSGNNDPWKDYAFVYDTISRQELTRLDQPL